MTNVTGLRSKLVFYKNVPRLRMTKKICMSMMHSMFTNKEQNKCYNGSFSNK